MKIILILIRLEKNQIISKIIQVERNIGNKRKYRI